MNNIQTFSQFVSSESHLLRKYGSHPGFCVQQAYNFTRSGPISRAAKYIVDNENNKCLLLKLHDQRPDFNPFVALLRTLEGHIRFISSVCITDDGKRAISGGYDGTLRMWDLISGECLGVFQEKNIGGMNIDITPDGKFAISADESWTIKVWDSLIENV